MSFDPQSIRAVVFDYGNTLIEFTARQVQALDRAIATALHERFGPFDPEKYKAMRRDAYRAPYFHPELREETVQGLLAELVRQLHGREPAPAELEPVIAIHDRMFVELIEAPQGLHERLQRLRLRYKLAVVSNYPCGKSIRASLARTGIAPYLDATVVSGDLGHVKPHPILFRSVLEQLRVEPSEAVFVGDNWLGDVQGAKRIGMWAVHTRQFDTLELFDRQEDHHDADLVIHHLDDLVKHLMNGHGRPSLQSQP